MSAERQKVLEMLAQGKISVEDADKLLEKLATAEGAQAAPAAGPDATTASAGKKPRFMRIVVDRPGREQVNVRVPLAFARTGQRLVAVLPPLVSEKLADQGIDLAALNMCDLMQGLEESSIDIDKGDGKKVRIYCE